MSEVTIESPTEVNKETLKIRSKARIEHIRKNGFLQTRPINPLIAWPANFGKQAAIRIKSDLNQIWADQGIEYRFDYFLYNSVDEIRREIERKNYDALFAVLPERSRRQYQEDDTHEKIKQRIEVPSQCIHIDHTVPPEWIGVSWDEFFEKARKQARRIQQMYGLCLDNLLVKHNWVPFVPATPFHYNVHIGLDVGGIHNNNAMACLGYNFRHPASGLIFCPEDIPIKVQKAEPIPTQYLYRGLLGLFELMHSAISLPNIKADFDNTIFYRDGRLLGQSDNWNEKDALDQLRKELHRRGWISSDAIWTAVEIHKYAEGFRLMRSRGRGSNPLTGYSVFPFDEEDLALVCTTGSPYLPPQGTACPLMIRIVDIYGFADRRKVVQDLVWQADMCFTKPDTGIKLPWVLHVADSGALQKSRAYKITGITV